MAKKLTRGSSKKLLEQRDDFIKAHPVLNQSYSQFLQDLKTYRESREPREKIKELNDYLIFGASFEK